MTWKTGKKAGGRDPQVPDPEQAIPEAKAQRNFTDPDSRIMVDGANKGSFIQAYNAQAAVDSEAQGLWRRRSPGRPTTAGNWHR
jgi:hypothetical protein